VVNQVRIVTTKDQGISESDKSTFLVVVVVVVVVAVAPVGC